MRFVFIATAILGLTTHAHACDLNSSYEQFNACDSAERQARAQTQALQDVADQIRQLRIQQQFDEPLLDVNAPFRR